MLAATRLKAPRCNLYKPLKISQRSITQTTRKIPNKARVVVIGGGIIGTSTAYHLAKLGWTSGDNGTIVFERDKITSGTTWHAAGLVCTFGSTSETSTEFRKYTRDLYATLEKETGVSTGWRQCGFIELASHPHRVDEFRRVAAFNRRMGIDVHEISPKEIQKLFPLCKVDDVLCGFYVKEDGRVNPVDVTMSLARGAKSLGVQFFEGCGVTDVKIENGFVKGVYLQDGTFVESEYVVNCTGMWARQIGEKKNIVVPNQAAEHYYLITEKIPEVKPTWPIIEDPSTYAYIRPEGDGLMVGLFEPHAAAWNVSGIPQDASFLSLPPDWERMTPFLEKAMSRVPATMNAGIKTLFCGPESFTPDLAPLLGETPEVRNYFVAAGMNSIGILTGGGVGRLMARWITTGKPDLDVTGMSVERLHAFQCSPDYRAHRVVESLGTVYKCHYPSHAMKTGRNAKRSPIHDRLAEQRAYFREVSGWESPAWYAPVGHSPVLDAEGRTGYWNRENWFPYWEREHKACRESVVLIDMSFMCKFLVQGRDAGKVLNYMSTANVDGPSETITYTQWLDSDGNVQADITVTKFSDEKFMVVATDTAYRHVETMLRRAISDMDARAFVTDVTGGVAQINIQGPKSRDLMKLVTDTNMDNSAFPFRAAKQIFIGYAPVTCVRITYVGELGYELYVPTEQAVHVYDRIIKADSDHNIGLVHAGLRALGSLRMEKAYRDYGHDISNVDGIYAVGLGFTCDYKKPNGFIGMEAAAREKSAPASSRLVQLLVLDPSPLLYHAEVVYRNGTRVGHVSSASYGHTLGGSVGLAMVSAVDSAEGVVNKSFLESGKWEIEISDKKYPIKVSLKPLYDPENKKIKI